MQNGYVVILATGMLLCVLTGNVDLGVGSVLALAGATAGIMMVDYGSSPVVAILAALAVGLVAGVFAGFFIAFLSFTGRCPVFTFSGPRIRPSIENIS